MRRWMLVVLAVVLLAPTALGQWIENLPLADDFVSPGERVLSQQMIVRHIEPVAVSPGTACLGAWPTVPGDAVVNDGSCAATPIDDDTLRVTGFARYLIPGNATILGIEVAVEGSGAAAGDAVEVRLLSGGQFAPVTLRTPDFPIAACGANPLSLAGGDDELWGRSWTPAQINAGLDVELIADLGPAGVASVDYLEVRVYYAIPRSLNTVRVRNGVPLADAVLGEHITRIQVVRVDDDQVIGTQSTTANLNRFTTDGVPIPISATYQAFTGTVELDIQITLRDTVPLLKEFLLNDTKVTLGITEFDVTYVAPAAQFIVGPEPAVAFDGQVLDSVVYPGQRFLAGRIEVDGSLVPFEMDLDQILLENAGLATQLLGTNIDAIEIRRASDDALLGQATTTELAKLTTGGTTIATTSNNTIPAYGMSWLEIWVTTDSGAPTGQNLQFAGDVRCNGTDFPTGIGPTFETGEPGGFEEVENLDLLGGRVFSGQRFLAQRIRLVDDDLDPYDVVVNSFAVENIADVARRLAESQIAKIELVRARDGEVMGEITNVSGLNAGGVRVLTPAANVVLDDTEEIVEVWVTLRNSIPHDRLVQLRTVVWHTENTRTFGLLHNAGPDSAEFETGPTVGQGFEDSDPIAVTNGGVFQGVRFLAQELKLVDDDADPYGITITSLMIRNMAPTDRLSSNNVARVEVRRKSDGLLLGEVVDPVNLHLAGERVATTVNNGVLDDNMVELEVWLTLKDPIPYGRKIELESIVWHQEGTVTFETAALVGPTTFTTEEGDPPTNVDFTWDPELPRFDEEITFDPDDAIADPEGAIGNATFEWDFGDGTTDQTDGPADVLHTYDDGGTFAVTLKVTGEDGLSTNMTHDIEVEGPPNDPPLIADITADPQSPAVGANVEFTVTIEDDDQPAGVAHDYAWDFDDGDTSTVAVPRHSFATAGTYTVEVTVTDDEGATGTATIEVAVGNDPPTLDQLTASTQTPNTGDEVEFTAEGYDDPNDDPLGEYRWDFGDGTTPRTTEDAGAESTTHIFGAPGIYDVTVRAVDDRGAESAEHTVRVTVSGPLQVIVYGFPNPASFAATITWFLPEGATNPILRVYNLLRGLVFEQALEARATQFAWDLRSTAGNVLPNGLYFCVVSATSAAGRNISSEIFRLLIAR